MTLTLDLNIFKGQFTHFDQMHSLSEVHVYAILEPGVKIYDPDKNCHIILLWQSHYTPFNKRHNVGEVLVRIASGENICTGQMISDRQTEGR